MSGPDSSNDSARGGPAPAMPDVLDALGLAIALAKISNDDIVGRTGVNDRSQSHSRCQTPE